MMFSRTFLPSIIECDSDWHVKGIVSSMARALSDDTFVMILPISGT